jgi:hypothetical protein
MLISRPSILLADMLGLTGPLHGWIERDKLPAVSEGEVVEVDFSYELINRAVITPYCH